MKVLSYLIGLHLLYVVAPKEAVESVSLNFKVYRNHILQFNTSVLKTAEVLGINENTAMKMIRNPNFTEAFIYVLKRFYIAMILHELWNGEDVFKVSTKFNVSRGIVYKLMFLSSSQAYVILKFCEEYEQFWVFKEIMQQFSKRLVYCSSSELLPLMELPSIKIVS